MTCADVGWPRRKGGCLGAHRSQAYACRALEFRQTLVWSHIARRAWQLGAALVLEVCHRHGPQTVIRFPVCHRPGFQSRTESFSWLISSSNDCELVCAFSASQHTFLLLQGQIALLEKMPAQALELDIQPFGLHVLHRCLKDVDPFSHGLSSKFLVRELLDLSFLRGILHCHGSLERLTRCFTPATVPSRVSLSAPCERRIVSSSMVSAYFRAEPVKRESNRAP